MMKRRHLKMVQELESSFQILARENQVKSSIFVFQPSDTYILVIVNVFFVIRNGLRIVSDHITRTN